MNKVLIGHAVGAGVRHRSCYVVMAEAKRPDGHFVWLEDRDGWLSVTNDAERVCKEITASFGIGVRIIYKDTDGNWDELVHRAGVFATFMPARHLGIS